MSFAQGRPVIAIPGPSPVPDRVLNAMHRPSPDIYGPELATENRAMIDRLNAATDPTVWSLALDHLTGLDRLRVVGEDEITGRGTSVAAGKYLTDDIYVELITDARGFTATQLEVSVTKWLSVLSQAGGSGVNSLNVRIRKDY